MAEKNPTYEELLERINNLEKEIDNLKKKNIPEEDRYRTIFEKNKAIALALDLKTGNIVDANPAATEFYGYSKAKLLTMNITDINLLSLDEIKEEMNATAEEKKNYFIFKHRLANGEIRDVEVYSSPFEFEGKATLYSIVHDITDRTETENKLKTTEERLTGFMNSASDNFYLLDAQLNFIEINQVAIDFLQKKKEDIIGKNIKDIVPDVISSGRYEKHLEVLSTGEPFVIENFIPHPVFGDKHFIIKSFKTGNGLGVIAFDITNQKKAEQLLSENKERYQSLIEGMFDGYAKVNMSGEIVEFNEAFRKLIGYNNEEIYHLKYTDITPQKWHQMEMDILLSQTFKEGYSKLYEKEYKRKDGSIVPVELRTHLIKDKNGEPSCMWAIVRDISERKKIEQEIIKAKETAEENEAKFRSYFMNSLDGIFVIDENGNYQDANPAAAAITGYSIEELCSMSVFQIVPDIEKEALKERLEILKNEGKFYREALFKRKDNSIGFWHISTVKLNHTKYLGFARDITDRKMAENALIENERRLTMALNATSDAIWEWNYKTGKTYYSPRWYEILGYETNELEMTFETWKDLCHPDDFQLAIDKMMGVQASTDNKGFTVEFRILGKNKEWIWMLCRGNIVVRDDDGNPLLLSGTNTDITEQKHVEEALRESEEKFSSLFRNAPVMMSLSDVETGKFTEVNETGHVISKFNQDELINKTSLEIGWLSPEDREKMLSILKEVGKIKDLELKLKAKDGEEIDVLYSGQILKIGNKQQLLSISQDIRKQKKIEAELIKAKEKAEESDRLKTAFLQNMSHEIRTPLNAIMGFAGVLANNFDDKEKLRNYSEIISRRGDDLLEIIDSILDIAKIEAGQLKVQLSPCNIKVLLTEVETFYTEYQKNTSKNHINFYVDNSCIALEKIILTDTTKLRQIFTNLINNAFKFTDSGSIKVGCLGIENNLISFYVSDTGIGIPKDKHDDVFIRFKQADNEISRLYGGTGLGLSIVQGILHLLGGKIWLDSEPGKGSTFYFSIPYNLTDSNASNNKKEISEQIIKEKATILIVEDDIYNSMYLKEILSGSSFTILSTEYGLEAVELTSQQEIDIILLDIQLPDISGYEVAKIIKQKYPEIFIIAQTAFATSSDREKAIEAGCDDYISKPLKKEVLIKALNSFLSTR